MADGDAGTQRNENTGPLVRSGSLLTPAGLRLLSSRPERASMPGLEWTKFKQKDPNNAFQFGQYQFKQKP